MGKGKIWQQLERIFIAIPSIQKFVDSTDKPEKTMDAWVEMLEGCDSDDLEHVVSKVVGGELELIGQWDKPDVVPRALRREANDIRSRRNAKVYGVRRTILDRDATLKRSSKKSITTTVAGS
jgi:hypothetical protein